MEWNEGITKSQNVLHNADRDEIGLAVVVAVAVPFGAAVVVAFVTVVGAVVVEDATNKLYTISTSVES